MLGLLFLACGAPRSGASDAGAAGDAGLSDDAGASADSGPADARLADASEGVTDAGFGFSDAGSSDAASWDSGSIDDAGGDAGADAGAPVSLDTVTFGIGVDYATVSGLPLVKAKLGFFSNIGNGYDEASQHSDLVDSFAFLDDIGPGVFCTSFDFDHYFKFAGSGFPNPAVDEILDAAGRPVTLLPTPTAFLRDYETLLASKRLRILHEIMGAPAQYQPANICKPAEHPAPTDIPAAAALMAQWAQSSNHAAPISWQIWNEPSHTLNQTNRAEDVECNCLASAADGSCKNESQAAYQARLQVQRDAVPALLDDLYSSYQGALSATVGPASSIGLASFLHGDFVPDKLVDQYAPSGEILFSADWRVLFGQKVEADFVSFNNFSGYWLTSLEGARSVLGAQNTSPLSFTQYAPAILSLPDGSQFAYLGNSNQPNNVQTLLDLLTDLSGMFQQADLEHVCMGNWLSTKLGFVTADKSGALATTLAHAVLAELGRMPALPLAMKGVMTYAEPADPGQVDQIPRGLHGFSTASRTEVATLLWNDALTASPTEYTVINLPAALAQASASARVTTWVGGANNSFTASTAIQDLSAAKTVQVPAQSVVLLTFGEAPGAAGQPASRRASLDWVDAQGTKQQARPLATDFPVYRQPSSGCAAFTGVSSCFAPTGSQGQFDPVRNLFSLAVGTAGETVSTGAWLTNLPDVMYVNLKTVANWGVETRDGVLSVDLDFASCSGPHHVTLSSRDVGSGGAVVPQLGSGQTVSVDLKSLGAGCWSQNGRSATITVSAAQLPAGVQVEGGLSATSSEGDDLAARLGGAY